MKKVVFGEAGAENFCLYTDPITIDLSQEGLTQISGPNGAGKTTIFDIIPYALYGITTKGLRAEDVINDKVEKNCHVWLEWKIDDDAYRVDRYLKYRKKGASSITLSKNGEPPYKNGANEVKAEVEKLLVPQKLFLNTLLFGQKVKSFFTDLTDSEQKDIFRNIINLGKYVSYRENAVDKINTLTEEIADLQTDVNLNIKLVTDTQSEIGQLEEAETKFYTEKNNELDILKSDVDELQKILEGLITEKEEFDSLKIDDKINEIHNRTQQISSDINIKERDKSGIVFDINTRVTNKKAELEKQAIEKRDEIFEELDVKYDSITSEMDPLGKKLASKSTECSEKLTEVKNQTRNVELRRNSIRSEMDNIHNNILCKEDAECPECKQQLVNKETKDIFKDKHEKLSIEFNDLEEEFGKLNQFSKIIVEKHKEESDKLARELSVLAKQLDEISELKKAKAEDIKFRLGEALKKLTKLAETETKERVNALQKEIDVLKIEIAEINKETMPLNTKKKELEILMVKVNDVISKVKSKEEVIIYRSKETFDASMLDSHKVKMRSLSSKIKEYNNVMDDKKEDLKIHEFWKEAFSSSGIPSMLIDEAIPFMNKRVSYYLDKLSAGRFSVSFDTMKETKSGEFRDKISINVVDNYTHANSRQKLSGGQTRLVDIATILTLGDLQTYIQDVSFNVMIFDEIFDSLDDENIKYVAGVLKELVENKSIFLITHRHIDVLEADNEINLWS